MEKILSHLLEPTSKCEGAISKKRRFMEIWHNPTAGLHRQRTAVYIDGSTKNMCEWYSAGSGQCKKHLAEYLIIQEQIRNEETTLTEPNWVPGACPFPNKPPR